MRCPNGHRGPCECERPSEAELAADEREREERRRVRRELLRSRALWTGERIELEPDEER